MQLNARMEKMKLQKPLEIKLGCSSRAEFKMVHFCPVQDRNVTHGMCNYCRLNRGCPLERPRFWTEYVSYKRGKGSA